MILRLKVQGENLKKRKLKLSLLAFIAVLSFGIWNPSDVRAPIDPVEPTSKGEVASATIEEVVQDVTPQFNELGLPKTLTIPIINLEADILEMGLTDSGNMESPLNVEDVGWYKYGARPGSLGSAVMAGHLGVGALERGIFINLDKLVLQDTITVTDEEGLTATFSINKIETYGKDEIVSEVFNRSDGRYLNLITCTGKWLPLENTYSQRLIIFADRVE